MNDAPPDTSAMTIPAHDTAAPRGLAVSNNTARRGTANGDRWRVCCLPALQHCQGPDANLY